MTLGASSPFTVPFLGIGLLPCNSLYRPVWPRTHKDLPVSASRVLGLKACVTMLHGDFLKESMSWSFDSGLGEDLCARVGPGEATVALFGITRSLSLGPCLGCCWVACPQEACRLEVMMLASRFLGW